MRVVTKGGALWLYEDKTIDALAAKVPWVIHSDPDIGDLPRDHATIIDGSCGFTGGAALAVGAAASAAHECGGFVNPMPQTVVRGSVVTTTMPMRQISV
ncbi:MAG: hypothetical protein AAF581_01800 [Planctomycetota bacterium]